MIYEEIEGDLIKLAQEGNFDVICHGVNCQSTMGAGIAPQMAKAFGCDKFYTERVDPQPNINRLGTIEFKAVPRGLAIRSEENKLYTDDIANFYHILYVVNAYTQYNFGKNHAGGDNKPLNYAALELCFHKINNVFSGAHLGLPLIGCGLAGGDWNIVRNMIFKTLTDLKKVTVVHFKPKSENGETISAGSTRASQEIR